MTVSRATVGVVLVAVGGLLPATSPGDGAPVGQIAAAAQRGPERGPDADPRLVLPSTIDRALKSEIEAAATSAALEQVLLRHPDQGQLLVPRLEAIGTAEIRREGPGSRFVITEVEPDQGARNSISLEAGPAGTKLSTEFPGDVPSPAFTDGSVHRFVGPFPFADLLTLFGDGDPNHRLTFAILADYGMVYLRGTGRVALPINGTTHTIQLGSSR